MNWKSTIVTVLAAVFVFALGSSQAAFAAQPTATTKRRDSNEFKI